MNAPSRKTITGVLVAFIALLMMILGYILFSRSLEQRFGRGVFSRGDAIAPVTAAADFAPANSVAAEN